ncbi:hypothetical protein KFZ70_09715 [Tamlana fucoidanivorans]|uniref:Fibronectin type-III domain-containing protein n=1 Tax=Allotamlana fucoidanivorans TaxID=2583814 RepID=A0A5C4SPA4_9FLAO|nr:FISUMP domain-containing protein [Tamlana fucoidanivorans]TNJ45857.1 hypothetical protein FGF67_05610 [Tamlana fucoidanivorans]
MKHIKKILLFIVIVGIIPFVSCDDDDVMVEQKPNLTLVSPEDNSNGIDIAPSFEWKASDPNGRPLKYDFYLGMDSTKLFLEGQNLKETTYRLEDYKIRKDAVYYWRVIAKNGVKNTESDIWRFMSIPAPEPPVLVSPETEVFVRNDVNLEWEAVPAGEGETIIYNVFLSTTDQFEESDLIATIEDGSTSYTLDVSGLDIGEVYYWKIDASDLINGSSSEVRSFKKLRPGAPDEPIIVSPANKSPAMSGVVLDWTDVTDPEGDAVSYDVYLDKFNQPATLVGTVTNSEFTTTNLDVNSAYYWYIVAKDPSGNFTESEVSGFSVVGASPGFPGIKDFQVANVLSLDEALIWEPASGATSYDVYIDTVNPPVNKVASDIVETQYLVKNSEIPSDITDVKTYYALVVAKDGSGGETNSFPVEFTPQMTGVYTDVRLTEVNDYTWVRLGTQIWMSQNLRTKKLTDGTDIPVLGPVQIPLTPTSTDIYCDEHPEGLPGFTPNWNEVHGRVYSSLLPRSTLIAPPGWHVMNDNDISTLRSYVSHASETMGAWHDGSDIFGLSFVMAGYRYDTLAANRPTGFRTGIEKGRVTYWTNGSGDNDVLELYLSGQVNGFRYYAHNNEHLRMWGIRLVKD